MKRSYIYLESTKVPDGKRTVSFKGVGEIGRHRDQERRKLARRNSKFRPLTDDEIKAFLARGFRVYDKRRGIYVHI